MKKINLVGQRFDRLLVIAKGVKPEGLVDQHSYWKCLCDCGNEITVCSYALLAGLTRSCKCLQAENRTKHGGYKKKVYCSWNGMIQRCEGNTDRRDKPYYKGKGIIICEEWHDFLNFEKWALENGYQDGLTLDRIDVNGNYEPSNCRWLTPKEQANNRTNNFIITIENVSKTLSEWSEITGIGQSTIRWRVLHGWSESDLFLPPNSVRHS